MLSKVEVTRKHNTKKSSDFSLINVIKNQRHMRYLDVAYRKLILIILDILITISLAIDQYVICSYSSDREQFEVSHVLRGWCHQHTSLTCYLYIWDANHFQR